MSTLAQRYEAVRQRAEAAARRSGRSIDDITIVAVSKTVPPEVVGQAIACGVNEFGENRTESLLPKIAAYPEAHWHFIGNIQSRKIKDIVGNVTLIHSVDRIETLRRIDSHATSLGVIQDVLLEVNVSGEESKSGFRVDEVEDALIAAVQMKHVHVHGFMTMAIRADSSIRSTFSGLRELRDDLAEKVKAPNISLTELSMGMSEDYEIGIEEGATIIRVGRSIFDEEFAETDPNGPAQGAFGVR